MPVVDVHSYFVPAWYTEEARRRAYDARRDARLAGMDPPRNT